jgi:Site-specific recombinase XerD
MYLTSPKYNTLLHFGIYSGLRVSDILSLQVKDVLEPEITVIEKKTKKKRVIEMDSMISTAIRVHIHKFELRENDFLFFSSATKKHIPVSRVQVYRVFRNTAAYLGLEGIGTHSMRKTFAKRHFEAHRDIRALQQILNHKYVSTTIGYLFSIKDLER